MAASAKNNEKKRSPAMATAIIVVFLLIVVMITLAMFTSFDLVTNRFDAGKVDIVLTETKWKPEDATKLVPGEDLDKNPVIKNNEQTDVFVFLQVTVPYDRFELEKDSGTDKGKVLDNSHAFVPLYKFMTLLNDNNTPDDPSDDNYTKTPVLVNTNEVNLAQSVNSGWYLMSTTPDTTNRKITYLYAYVGSNGSKIMEKLTPGSETSKPLFDKVCLQNINGNIWDGSKLVSFGGGRTYGIVVEAYGIQADYLGTGNEAESVWARIDS